MAGVEDKGEDESRGAEKAALGGRAWGFGFEALHSCERPPGLAKIC
jgi:hypothetical protein